MNINDALLFSLCSVISCIWKRCETLASAFTGAAAGNAQAVLNAPLVLLIVQPRKHRKLPTTSVWNGRNCLCHGSTKIRLRRSYTCILRRSRSTSVRGETELYPDEKRGLKCCFSSISFPEQPQKRERPGCVSSSRQRTGGDCGATL